MNANESKRVVVINNTAQALVPGMVEALEAHGAGAALDPEVFDIFSVRVVEMAPPSWAPLATVRVIVDFAD